MKTRFIFPLVALVLGLLLMLLTPTPAFQQGAGVALFVTGVAPKTTANGFPEMQAALVVPGTNGLHQAGLAAKDFTLLEDNRPVSVTGVNEQVTTTAPVAVCLAIDISDSMGQKKNPATDKLFIKDAIDAAKSFIGKLGSDDQVCVIAFGDRDILLDTPPKFDPGREKDFSKNIAEINAMLDGLNADTGKRTALYDAALKAIKVTASKQFPGTRAVILFTDGKDERIGPDGATRLEGSLTTFDTLLTQASASRVPVFTIGVGDDVDPTNLKRLAVNAGANYYDAKTPADLAGPFDLIYNQLKTQYLVTYNSHLCRDGKDHVLQARVRAPSGEAETRNNFSLPLFPNQPSVCLYYTDGGERKELINNLKLRGTVNLTPQIETSEAISLTVFIADDANSTLRQQICTANSLPATCAWNTNKEPFGQHSITVRAQDRRGQIGQTTAVVVTEQASWIETLNEMPIAAKTALVGIPLLLIVVGGILLFRMTRKPAMCPRGLHVMPAGAATCPFCAEDDARMGAAQIPTPAYPTMPPIAPPPPPPPPPQFGGTEVMGESRSAEGVPPMATVSLRVQPVSIAFLVMERGTHQGKQYTLHAGDTTIGRAGTNDIVVDDPTVGRQQSKIKLEGKEYFLYDLAATNATRVNGKESRGRRKLEENDRIEMGNVSFVFKRVQSK